MATECHERGRRGDQHKKKNTNMDMDFNEIRSQMDMLKFKMQQDSKSQWVYEWPMKKRVKWPIKELLARG
jgi:hypothetical protein